MANNQWRNITSTSNVFCASISPTHDGKLLVSGGHSAVSKELVHCYVVLCYTGISHGGCYPHMSSIHAQTSSHDQCLGVVVRQSVTWRPYMLVPLCHCNTRTDPLRMERKISMAVKSPRLCFSAGPNEQRYKCGHLDLAR
jgi:hypothetical protein